MPKRKKHVAWCDATTYGVSTGENREDWDRNYEPQTTYRLIPKQQVPDGKFASMQFTVKLSVSQRTVELTVLLVDIFKQDKIMAALQKCYPKEFISSTMDNQDFVAITTEHMRIWRENNFRVGRMVKNIGTIHNFYKL